MANGGSRGVGTGNAKQRGHFRQHNAGNAGEDKDFEQQGIVKPLGLLVANPQAIGCHHHVSRL